MDMPIVPDYLINMLVEIGSSKDIPGRIKSAILINNGYVMRLGPRYWKEKCKTLNKAEVIALIKCFTIIEKLRINDWSGGSISPVIYLFEYLIKLDPSNEEEIANWILANTNNEYLPYGRFNWNANSLNEYYARKTAHSTYVEKCHEEEAERQQLAKIRKAEKATSNLAKAIQRRDTKAVISLLKLGANPNISEPNGVNCFELASKSDNDEIREIFSKLEISYKE